MLAPHPFYQARGTPIAADLVLRVLSERGDKVDLVVFPEGKDVQYPNVSIYRTPAFKILSNVRPGFSWQKLVCDAFLLLQAIRLAKSNRYDVIHAGEEAVFIALLLKKVFGIPYVYDMDSSLAQQLIDKSPQLQFAKRFFQACENLAVRNAKAVIAVCQALATEIQPYRPQKVAIIPDISMLNAPKTRIQGAQNTAGLAPQMPVDDLKTQLGIAGPLMMYVGNLESYQGIDLLLASFAKALPKSPTAHLVAIGGTPDDIQKYQAQADRLNISANVHFVGPRPIAQLKPYLDQADMVVSPRTQGNNTPMKLYSYLDSGKALLATNLTTHTQVLNCQIAWLAEPTVTAFAEGISHLINHPDLRLSLGKAAQAYIAREHTYEVFSQKLSGLYSWIEDQQPIDSAPSAIAQ
ncbi:MAG: glycosyltransferase [Phormidesmis sp.]